MQLCRMWRENKNKMKSGYKNLLIILMCYFLLCYGQCGKFLTRSEKQEVQGNLFRSTGPKKEKKLLV